VESIGHRIDTHSRHDAIVHTDIVIVPVRELLTSLCNKRPGKFKGAAEKVMREHSPMGLAMRYIALSMGVRASYKSLTEARSKGRGKLWRVTKTLAKGIDP
jgi:hypothetical protein